MQMHEIWPSLHSIALMHPHDGFQESRHLEFAQYIGQGLHVNSAKSISSPANTKPCATISDAGAAEDRMNTQETNQYGFRPGFHSVITPEELNALRQLFEWMSHGLMEEPVVIATASHFSTHSV